MSPPRRINDAQVERLLDAMRRDPKYRATLAKRIVEREGHSPGTADYNRRYKSTMRRFQRYVTEAGEKRSFARASVEYQRETRQVARSIPLPSPTRTIKQTVTYTTPEQEVRRTVEYAEPIRDISLNDLRAIVAYHDGDIRETTQVLSLSARGGRLLDLAVSGEGVDIFGLRGSGEVADQVRDFLDSISDEDAQDIQDFHDLLMDLPDWQISMILGDLEDGETTFAEWIDAWRDDGMTLDASQSRFWELWRAAYARTKA